MFSRFREDVRAIPGWLLLLWLLLLILLGGGAAANLMVVDANDGKMPVAMRSEDVLFTIGAPTYGVTDFPSAQSLGERHQPLTEQSKLRVLADRIPIAFTFIPQEGLPRWCYDTLARFKIYPNEGGIASIGDLLIWLGMLVAPLVILALLFRLFCEIYRGIRGLLH